MNKWNLTNKRLYQQLNHPRTVEKNIVEDMTSAYMEFVGDLFDYINKEKDMKELMRNLNTSYIDFETLKSLEKSSPTENHKLKIIFLDKLMSLIDKETELIYRQMEYPKFFITVDSDWKSPFYLNSDIIRNIDIMEIICALFYIEGGVYRYDHKEVFLSEFIRIFEKMFNIEIKDVYKKEASVIKRKPSKITEFLDKMKTAIIEKSRREGYYIERRS